MTRFTNNDKKIPNFSEPIQASTAEITFSAFAKDVLLHKHEEGLADSTFARYIQLFNRIEPVIGMVPLSELGVEHLKALYVQLSRRGERMDKAKATALPALYELKESHGLSLGAISRLSGVPATTVSAMFNGRTVEAKSAMAVAHALGKKEPELFSVEYGKNKLAKKTILEHYRLIYMILEYAVNEGYIPKNIAKDASPDQSDQKAQKTLTTEELDRF